VHFRRISVASVAVVTLLIPSATQAKPEARSKRSLDWANAAIATHSRPWCSVHASYNSYDEDYDVYVHSNQPYRDAQVWQKGREVYGYKTNGEGYADIYVFTEM
jgi:hypothetical protein